MNETACVLADEFMSAALEPTNWMPALLALAEATGSARGQLIDIGGPSTIPFNWVNDFSERAHHDFVSLEGGSPLVNPRVAVSVGASLLTVQSEADYRAAATAIRSDAYADFSREHDIPHGCQSKLIEADGALIGLAVLRTERDGPTTEAQRALFAAVAPHVRSAVRTQMALENDGARLVAGAMEHVAAAVFICGADGRLFHVTPSAELLLAEGVLCRDRGRLSLADRRQGLNLREAIARHALTRGMPLESLTIDRGPGRLPIILDIVAAPRQPWAFGFESRVLIVARGVDRWHASAETVLQTFYGLSPSEADIALRLARGQSHQMIAEERRARIATVRSQIKTIFMKLGVTREVELITMLAQLFRV